MLALDRYLRAVRFWLPRSQRDDIIAELSDDLRSEIEGREAELGRPLADAELAAMLAGRANPIVMAARYTPQASLIGPTLFPIYRFVLRTVALVYLLPAIILGSVILTVAPSSIPGLSWFELFRFLFVAGGYAVACITLVFAAIERGQRRAGGWEAWQAALRDPNRISSVGSIVELVAAAWGTLWWAGAIGSPTVDEVTMTLGPLARAFYWPILCWFLVSVALAAMKLRSGRWTPLLTRANLTVTSIGLVIFSIMLAAWLGGGSLVAVTSSGLPPAKITAAEKWMNLMWAGLIAGFVIGCVVTAVQDLRRIRRITLPPAMRPLAVLGLIAAVSAPSPLEAETDRPELCGAAISGSALRAGDSAWAGWGPDGTNRRFQGAKAAGISAADVPRLQLRWAFNLGKITDARGQPTVVGGRVFVGTPAGTAYALDARSGCVHWTFEADGPLHGAIVVGSSGAAGRRTAFFGDQKANAYAVDAATGTLLWRVHVDEHRAARITGAPVFHAGVLYAPVSSYEEAMVFSPKYECCTFRGSLLALDAATGKTIWKTFTIADSAQPTTKGRTGAPRRGPSGAPIWSAPTYDDRLNVLYVATGNNYSDPATSTSDAVLAFDAKTGRVLWSRQFAVNDAANMGCDFPGKPFCPESDGPDADFGQSPILVRLPNGGRALVIGQKSGMAHGIDPDAGGAVLWDTRVAQGGKLGGMQWGSAADAENMYAAISDVALRPYADTTSPAGFSLDVAPDKGGGLVALDLATGRARWRAKPADACGGRKHCGPAQSAAVTVIPGVVFSGAMDGHLRAYAAGTGAVIWDFDSMREFETVNGPKAHGGSLDVGGVAVAYRMLFVSSGYGFWGGTPGNVLLAFSVEGKEGRRR